MDVAVTEFRAHLRAWLEQVAEGEEIVVTDRGLPIARILGIDAMANIERLTQEGVIARPASPVKPDARGRKRPRPKRPVADRVSEQRN